MTRKPQPVLDPVLPPALTDEGGSVAADRVDGRALWTALVATGMDRFEAIAMVAEHGPKVAAELWAEALRLGTIPKGAFTMGSPKNEKGRDVNGPEGAPMDHLSLTRVLLATGMDRMGAFQMQASQVLKPLLDGWLRAQLEAGASEAELVLGARFDTGMGNMRFEDRSEVFERLGLEGWWAGPQLRLSVSQPTDADGRSQGAMNVCELGVDPEVLSGVLPKGLVIQGPVHLSGWAALEHLPEGFAIHSTEYRKNVTFENCTRLKELVDGIRVEGDLILRGCSNLEKLPKGLTIKNGCLDLRGCSSWDGVIPDDAEITGWIFTDLHANEVDEDGMPVTLGLADWRERYGNASCFMGRRGEG